MRRVDHSDLHVDNDRPVVLDGLLVGVGDELDAVDHDRGRLQVLLLDQLDPVVVAGDAVGEGPGVLARREGITLPRSGEQDNLLMCLEGLDDLGVGGFVVDHEADLQPTKLPTGVWRREGLCLLDGRGHLDPRKFQGDHVVVAHPALLDGKEQLRW
jgi:hypothetical protein